VLHLSLHTGIATAGKRTANFNAIHRPHDQPPRPIGTQNSVAFQSACNFTIERKHGFRTSGNSVKVVIFDRPKQTVLPAMEEVMEYLAELMQRLLEIQNGERQRSPELIAEDERLMNGLQTKLSQDGSERNCFKV
jgi:hypothetical protein